MFHFSSIYFCGALWIRDTRTNMFETLFMFAFFFFVVASMARLLESQESQSRLIREYERTREKTASQAMNE